MLRRNTNDIIISFVLDLVSLVGAIYLAEWLRLRLAFGYPLTHEPGIWMLLFQALLIYPIVFIILGLYDPERTYRAVDEYQLLSIASFFSALALAGVVYFTNQDISRLTLLYFYGFHFIFVGFWRVGLRLTRRIFPSRNTNQSLVLLVGGGQTAEHALERLDALDWAGIHLVGYLTDGELIRSREIPFLGTLDDADRVVQQMSVDDVLVALPAESYLKVQLLTEHLIDKPCNIWVIPDYFNLLIYGGKVKDLGEVPMISLKSPTLTGYQRVIKRAFDLLVGGIVLVFISPILGVIALAIKLDSAGPVIFKQRRVGENGKMFWMYKFRSMVRDADDRLKEVIRYDQDGNLIHKSPDDPRVTNVGHFLRRTSLDELPQIFNVLRGDMSLVGPRPELPVLVEQYAPWQRKRFAVPQGMTGWWQVNGRSNKPMHLNTEDDIYYVQNYSLLLDVQILVKTVWVVMRGKGAY